MMRAIICCVALFAFTPAVRAGELDREGSVPKAKVAPAEPTAAVGSELDRESPQDAHHYHGGWGGHRGYGWGGWGYRPYVGWGGYPGFGWGGYYPARFYNPGFYSYRTYAWGWPGAYYNWAWYNYYPAYYYSYPLGYWY